MKPLGGAVRSVTTKLPDARIRRAIADLANYLEREERRHYESCSESHRRHHTYRSVEIVRSWLNNG